MTGYDVFRLRLYFRFSQREMAWSSGISQSTISRLENYVNYRIPAHWEAVIRDWYVQGPRPYAAIKGFEEIGRPSYVVPRTGPGLRKMIKKKSKEWGTKASLLKEFVANRMQIKAKTLESYFSMKRLPAVAIRRLKEFMRAYA